MLFKYNCRASRLHASFAMCILHSINLTATPSRLKNLRLARVPKFGSPLASPPPSLCTPATVGHGSGTPWTRKLTGYEPKERTRGARTGGPKQVAGAEEIYIFEG
jgi:hypothetical protein